MPDEWNDQGADADAVLAVLMVLRETDFTLSSPTIAQLFQGTAHEKTLAAAQADMLNWGEGFDVAAEFAGLLSKLDEGQRRQSFQALQEKAQGGPASLSDAEREQYKQLMRPGTKQAS
jgi:DNA primase